MMDLEREVRELLERQAEEAAAGAGDRIPAEIHNRVRQRQARTLIMSGLAVALLAVGALAGARALLLPTDRQPGSEASIPPDLLEEPAILNEIASGEFRGHRWSLLVGRQGETECVGVEMDTGSGTSCAPNLVSRRPMEASTFSVTGFPGVVVAGAVSESVDRVVFDFDAGGRIDGQIYATPGSISDTFDAFVIFVPNERPARGVVLAMDAKGQLLAAHGIYATRALKDVYGNVVGFLSQSDSSFYSVSWVEPGTPLDRVRIEDIRHVAGIPLVEIRPEVREWWERRPPQDASDDAFLDWWASYPVTN
jgi:hypothetical protein